MTRPPRPFATDNMLRVLRAMAAAEDAGEFEDGELVCDGGSGWWLGLEVVAPRTVERLLACMAVSERSEREEVRRLGVNGTGRAILADPSVAETVMQAILTGGAFDSSGKELSET